MLDIFKKVLTARIVAALVGIATTVISAFVMNGGEYALASVCIATAAIASPIFYQPFSKYVLIGGDWQRIGGAFFLVQPAVVCVLVVIGAGLVLSGVVDGWLAASAVLFAVSQGWKEFTAELARARSAIGDLHRLYVNDAITTLGFTCVALWFLPEAKMMLLAGGASSAIWAIRCLPKRSARRDGDISLLYEIYRYSFGIVGASALNSFGLSALRVAINQVTSPATSGAFQYLLDMLQKPAALLGSTATSAALPEIARGRGAQVPQLIARILAVAWIALSVFAIALIMAPNWLPGMKKMEVAPGLALIAAAYIWMNRYKSSAMEITLVASDARGPFVILGGFVTVGGIAIVARYAKDLSFLIFWGLFSLFISGLVSLLFSKLFGLARRRELLEIAAWPALVILVMGVVYVFS